MYQSLLEFIKGFMLVLITAPPAALALITIIGIYNEY